MKIKIVNQVFHQKLDAFKAIVNQEKKIDYKYLYMKPGPKNPFDFRIFMALKPLFQTIYFGEVLIKKERPRYF